MLSYPVASSGAAMRIRRRTGWVLIGYAIAILAAVTYCDMLSARAGFAQGGQTLAIVGNPNLHNLRRAPAK